MARTELSTLATVNRFAAGLLVILSLHGVRLYKLFSFERIIPGQGAEQMQRRLANFERNGLEGRRRGDQGRRAHGSPNHLMGIDASKPSRSSQKSDNTSSGNSASNLKDGEIPKALTEKEAL